MNKALSASNIDISPFDIAVIGGGIAALSAAISARELGASVVMMEAAPKFLRGGNTRHSRNLRVMHPHETEYLPGSYPEAIFIKELEKTSKGICDPVLTRLMVQKSCELPEWLARQGVALQTKHIPFSRKTLFFLGGGRAAINALYQAAEILGVQIFYDHPVSKLSIKNQIQTTIICCGGSQADPLPGIINRGTPFAKGEILSSLLQQKVMPFGMEDEGHLVAVDARSPEHDGGIVTRIDGMEYGIVVDKKGQRFQDETVFKEPTRYSIWGRCIAALPDKYAILILDSNGIKKAPFFAFPPIQTTSIAELAKKLGVDADLLLTSINQTDRVFTPPFFALPIRPGIAFNSHGIKINETSRLVMCDGTICNNIFAAGMIMAPNILGSGYLAGAGITIGAVFGRIAGEEAARHALG